jgi:hypothetical protein
VPCEGATRGLRGSKLAAGGDRHLADYRTVLIPALGLFGLAFGLWYAGIA